MLRQRRESWTLWKEITKRDSSQHNRRAHESCHERAVHATRPYSIVAFRYKTIRNRFAVTYEPLPRFSLTKSLPKGRKKSKIQTQHVGNSPVFPFVVTAVRKLPDSLQRICPRKHATWISIFHRFSATAVGTVKKQKSSGTIKRIVFTDFASS